MEENVADLKNHKNKRYGKKRLTIPAPTKLFYYNIS